MVAPKSGQDFGYPKLRHCRNCYYLELARNGCGGEGRAPFSQECLRILHEANIIVLRENLERGFNLHRIYQRDTADLQGELNMPRIF